MPHLIHNARFVIASIENAEEAAERLRDEVGAVAAAEAPYHFARRDIAAGDEEVKLAFLIHEELANGDSATQEAWSQARAEAALAWLVARLERCPTFVEAQERGQVEGRLTANAGGSAEYSRGS